MNKLTYGLLAAISALCLLGSAGPARAANCGSLPYTLTNGQVADANQVMSNLNAILTCANASLAHNGLNSDITSLTGLTTPLSVGQGGTGANTAAGAIANLGGLVATNNLADLTNLATARTNIGTPLGTSGATLCLLNSACTWSASQAIGVVSGADALIIKNITTGTFADFFPITNGADTDLLLFFSGPGASKFKWSYTGDYAILSGGHYLSTGTAPTPSACGVSPTMAGASDDNRGQVNVGTGGPTSCTITFNRAFGSIPFCTANVQTGAVTALAVGPSTTAVTFSWAGAVSAFQYMCQG